MLFAWEPRGLGRAKQLTTGAVSCTPQYPRQGLNETSGLTKLPTIKKDMSHLPGPFPLSYCGFLTLDRGLRKCSEQRKPADRRQALQGHMGSSSTPET